MFEKLRDKFGNNRDNNDNNDESTFMQKFEDFKYRFKLGSHHKMERFTVTLGVSVLCLLLCTGVSFTKNRIETASLVDSQSVFTEDFTFSLSGESGHVLDVYGNADGNKRLVLFQFDHINNLSTDADNYYVFVTGQSKSLKISPDTYLSFFGATGYGFLYIDADEPLDNEIWDIVLRSNRSLDAIEVIENTEDVEDASFAEFDQAQFYVNLGANGVTILDDFDFNMDDPCDLYIELIANAEDEALHEEVMSLMSEMSTLLTKKTEYEERILSYNYELPEEPLVMRNDYIDDNGVLQSQTNVALAYDFDYVYGTISEGYLNQVIGNMNEYSEYMTSHTEKGQDPVVYARDKEREAVIASTSAVNSVSGAVLDFASVKTGVSSDADVTVKEAFGLLEDAWSDYINVKRQLQIKTAQKFLLLDATVQSQTTGYNTTENQEGTIYYY